MELSRYLEGKTRLIVPRVSIYTNPPPTFPVFFNPAASLNRDVTVAMTSAAGGRSFCDSMAGVGARGVRVARETKNVSEVVMVDFNEKALKLAKRSAALNRVAGKCSFALSETNSYLFSRFGRDQRFDYVDLDPFGTPIRQLQGALSATAEGGVLSVTATDTAVLCGVNRSTCMRRYGATPLNNHFHHETGLRILLAAVARNGGSVDIGIEPVAAHSTRHYLRVFVKVMPGASRADAALGELGVLMWCPHCGEVQVSGDPPAACPICGKRTKLAGPLWAGDMAQEPLVDAARREAASLGLAEAAKLLESLRGVNEFPPWSFDIDAICSSLKAPTVPELLVYKGLLKSGHRVMRTPFEKTGIKTDATHQEVERAVREAGAEKVGRGSARPVPA